MQLVEVSATEQFLRAERVSVSSDHKSIHVVMELQQHTLYNNHINYRTNNHAGLPKGSYLNPNPQHFHIVQHKEIAKPMRPYLIKAGTFKQSSHYVYNRVRYNRRRNVIINIDNIHSVSVSMSFETLFDFIQPFANVLNLYNLPILKHQSCQTAYNIESRESSNSSEKEIMEKLHNNLMQELGENNDTCDFDETASVIKNEGMAQNYDDSLENSIENRTVTDEGFEDLAKSPDNKKIDDNIMKLCKPIFDYIVEQSFNNRELLIFPELDRDPNIDKLLTKLSIIYQEIYKDLDNQQKNELRLSICRYILDLVETKDFMKSTNSSSDSDISDRFFSITEFLFELLDRFFDLINNPSTIHHSTPETTHNSNRKQTEQITSFKKDTKSQSESYWIAITSSPVITDDEKPKVARRIINVDEIPLPIPDDLIQRSDRDVSDDFHLIDNNGGGDSFDKLNDCTYINFNDLNDNGDCLENQQFSQSFSFYRTNDSPKSFTNKTTIIFNQSLDRIDENSNDDDGDWMGYEFAKF